MIADALGKRNIIALHQAHHDFIPAHTGPLSLKCAAHGVENYELDNQRISVKDSRYLIVNKGQPYSSSIASRNDILSVCVFFSDSFVSDVYRTLTQPGEVLLDDGNENIPQSEVNFYQKLYWKNDDLGRLIGSLGSFSSQYVPQSEMDDWCVNALELLFLHHKEETSNIYHIRAAKRSTREELYKRLCRSIDFIHQQYETDITLQQLSEVSFLSAYHLHRLFKDVTGLTPHQYVTRIRMNVALHLLRQTKHSLSEISSLCGFENESSFIRSFKRAFGTTPVLFRKHIG